VYVTSRYNLGADTSVARHADITFDGGTLDVAGDITEEFRVINVLAGGGTINVHTTYTFYHRMAQTTFFDYLKGTGDLTIKGGGTFSIYKYTASGPGLATYQGNIYVQDSGTCLYVNTRYATSIFGDPALMPPGKNMIYFANGTSYWLTASRSGPVNRVLDVTGDVTFKVVNSSQANLQFSSYVGGVGGINLNNGSVLHLLTTNDRAYDIQLTQTTLLGNATIDLQYTGPFSELWSIGGIKDDGAGYNFTKTGTGTLINTTAPISIAGNFTLSAGGITQQLDTTIGGNWTNAGTFTHGSKTVEFTGSGTSTITGNTTFYNLKCVTPSKALRFADGGTFTVSGALQLDGQSPSTRVSVASVSGTPTTWNLVFNGTNSCANVAVQGAYTTGTGIPITVTGSQDNGDNTGWIFS
jgi:hypothetical protein